jgi:hypothetical protein
MTSNTGAEVYRGQTIGFNLTGDLTAMDKEVDRRLSETFRFEFLNRFDQVVHFHPLSRNHIRTIALRELEQLKQRVGFNMNLRYKGRVEIENRGYIVELFAENESVLSRLLPDLAKAWSKQPADNDVARIYGKDGVVQDSRTGVTSNRIKEIWKGRLDEFLEGWRRMRA